MCAICGSYDQKEARRMLRVMKHRAPDGRKVVSQGGYSIGMGRLAIIDLKSPNLFPFEEKGYVLTFNGEIYNYRELRAEMEKWGIKFRTQSDTEVLLRMYQHYGMKCLEYLNGMFAFVVYEPERQSIFMARDLAGEKPLYYSLSPDGLRFASEAKALNWNCVELAAAHAATYDLKSKTFKMWKWWEPKPYPFSPNLTKEQELEILLEDSIKLRTRADVPYGLYYSGGIDSSLIFSFHAFNKLFSYSDSPQYENDFKENLKKIVWHLDYPVRSFSPYGLWRLAREASQSVKVILSGEGADELFGGYVRYVLPQFCSEAQKEFPSYKTMFSPAMDANEYGRKEFYGNLQELLRQGDRMASAWGIENRCPFLDRRIIDFAFSLEPKDKIDGIVTKKLLRKVLQKRFPSYRHIEKAGLYCSVNRWIGEPDPLDKRMWLETQEKIWKSFV